jgi:Lrp/AsnC family leucine-responsive transcriptional regulator
MRIDALDASIVGLLQEDARLSFREIAEKLGSTTPTVSARIKVLEDIGLLQGYHARLDPTVLGGAMYIVTVNVHPQSAREALAKLQAMPGITRCHLLAGGRLVAQAHLRPPSLGLPHLHEALATLPGLATYDASEVLAGQEQRPREALPENVEVPCHQCQGPIHAEPVKGRFGERAHVFCCRQCLVTFRERFEKLATGGKAPTPKPEVGHAPAPRTAHDHH